MIELTVKNQEGKEVETIKLDEVVFNDKIPASSVYQVINSYMANQRKGLASTKTRGEVSGGGRKPWKQKGTGRARVGSTRSPLWRHGGVIFGPHPRDFSFQVPKKIKSQALQYAFCQKIKQDSLVVIEDLKVEKPKTKEMVKILAGLKIDSDKNILVLLDKVGSDLRRAFANIDFLTVELVKNVHTYQVLAARKIVISRQGLKELTQRLKN